MPIYSYSCPTCGHKQDHLQKLNEVMDSCPKCASRLYSKQLTAPAGFSVKGETIKSPCGADSHEMKEIGCIGGCACHPH
jgi:putative FmdB family regulatory protein